MDNRWKLRITDFVSKIRSYDDFVSKLKNFNRLTTDFILKLRITFHSLELIRRIYLELFFIKNA